jgi:hypothetical protein
MAGSILASDAILEVFSVSSRAWRAVMHINLFGMDQLTDKDQNPWVDFNVNRGNMEREACPITNGMELPHNWMSLEIALSRPHDAEGFLSRLHGDDSSVSAP